MCLELDLDRNPALSPLPPEHIVCNELHFLIPTHEYNKGEFAFAGHHLKLTFHKKIEKNFPEMVDDIRAPAAWRRPKTKIYDYNQDMGCAYYKVRQRQ